MEKMADDVMHQVNTLTKISEELRNSTAGFKTKGSELMILDLAKTDHRVFIGKIGACLKGDASMTRHNCRIITAAGSANGISERACRCAEICRLLRH